jgi:phosphate transport system protein
MAMSKNDGRYHILRKFDDALAALRANVVMMRDLTDRSLVNAARGFFERDDSRCKVAIADDEEIDFLEVQVDRDGIEVLRRFQPVARDLRNVVATMKICSSLERAGDQAVNIARRACKLNLSDTLPEVEMLLPMYERAISMFRDSFRAYLEEDVSVAVKLKDQDRALDEMNHKAATQFTECMGIFPDRVSDYVNLLFVARHFERVGDLATNIAEDAVYSVSAEDVRHLSSRRECP